MIFVDTVVHVYMFGLWVFLPMSNKLAFLGV